MAVTLDDVRTVADLARLQLSDEEESLVVAELNMILSYMEKLNELNTEDVEPASRIISSGDSFRPDEAEFFPHRDEILGQVPKIKDGYVVVPKIID